MLNVGDKAPLFCMPNQDEVEICLRDILGKWIVLYFYPKDDTPGCTMEACDFTQAMPQFDACEAVILGVSPNSASQHRKFIEKYDLGMTLLADEEMTMCQDYGVWQLKKFMGKEFMGAVRTTFIIDPKGEIAAVWNKVSVRKKKKIQKETHEVLHVNEVKNKLDLLQANEGTK